jgi:5-(carboxyamino)imidazole ribonucleotide synthase
MHRVSKRSLSSKIGILGGGQLARMLALAAHPLGLQIHVLSQSSDDPAAKVTRYWQQGGVEELASFSQDLEALTFESEFFNVESIRKMQIPKKCYIFPNLKCMGLFQDRLSQKNTLLKFDIPTSRFRPVNQLAEIEEINQEGLHKIVLKKRMGGYDGNGTFILHQMSALQIASLDFQQGFIAEKWIPFKRECAVMAFRSRDGSCLHYPLVEVKSQNRRCDLVWGPTHHPQFKKMMKKIFNMMKKLDYVGALGIEFFDTGKELLVNELAPRVHNTGHYSQQALQQDQFTLHLLCGLGRKLEKVTFNSNFFAMKNLIGSKNNTPHLNSEIPHLHWYGKNENRIGRKMGHINAIGNSRQQVLKTLEQNRKKIQL